MFIHVAAVRLANGDAVGPVVGVAEGLVDVEEIAARLGSGTGAS